MRMANTLDTRAHECQLLHSHLRHNLNEIMFYAVYNWYFWLKVIHTFSFRSCISRGNHVIVFHSTIFLYSWVHFFHFRLVDGDSKQPTYAPYYISTYWAQIYTQMKIKVAHTISLVQYEMWMRICYFCSRLWWTHSDNVTFLQTRRSVNKLAAADSVQP